MYQEYVTEYSVDKIEMHSGSVKAGQRVLLVSGGNGGGGDGGGRLPLTHARRHTCHPPPRISSMLALAHLLPFFPLPPAGG